MAVTAPELDPRGPSLSMAERPCPLQPPGNNHLSCGREDQNAPLLMAGYWAKTLTTVPWGSSCYCSHLTEEKTEAQEVNSGTGACTQAGLPQRLDLGLPVLSVLLLCSPPQAEESGPCASHKPVGGRGLSCFRDRVAWRGVVATAHSKTSDQLPRARGWEARQPRGASPP